MSLCLPLSLFPVSLSEHLLCGVSICYVTRLGTVGSFSKPWSEVLFDDGVKQHMRGRELSRSLSCAPSDFYDPHPYYYDFGDLYNGWDKERILGDRYDKGASMKLTRRRGSR